MKDGGGLTKSLKDVISFALATDKGRQIGQWRQVFLGAGETITTSAGDPSITRLASTTIVAGAPVVLCLFCGDLLVVGGCGTCGSRILQVNHEIGDDGIREYSFFCGVCKSRTASTWTCPQCRGRNPLHLTLGKLWQEHETNSENP